MKIDLDIVLSVINISVIGLLFFLDIGGKK